MFYQKGSKRLHEYLDIRNIIKRLQDLDKLKMILLSDDQRKIFEYIPKPDVVDSKTTMLQFTTRVKTKKMTKNFPNTMRSLAENNDPINRRILECFDQKLKNDIENNDKKGIF